MQKDKRIVIVGAGIIGAACAFWLNKYTDFKIIILEKSAVASGTTHYSLGLRNTKVFNPKLLELAENSFNGYEELKKDIPDLPEIRLPISFYFERNKYQKNQLFIEKYDNSVGKHTAFHSAFEALTDTMETHHSFACLGNAVLVTKKIFDYVLSKGKSELRENSLVTGTSNYDDKILVTVNEEYQIGCDKIVYCTGSSTLFNSEFKSVAARFRTKKVAFLELMFKSPGKQGVAYLQDDKAFLVFPQDGKRGLLSYTSDEWDITPPFSKLQFNERDAELSGKVLQKYFKPNDYEIVSSGIHCDIYSNDWMPKVISNDNRTFFITGSSGSGYKYATGLAEILTNKILN